MSSCKHHTNLSLLLEICVCGMLHVSELLACSLMRPCSVIRNKAKWQLSLPLNPQAFAEWYKMVETDQAHPENHTALLWDKDATEMACYMHGECKHDSRSVCRLS